MIKVVTVRYPIAFESRASTLEIELNRILEILPRTRRKADAYKGLRSKLKQQGVELVITSNGHLKNKK